MKNKSFTIKQILSDHWDSFLSLGYDLRPFIPENVEKVIHCGDSAFGHALYFCDHCNKFKYVLFRCKSRFCNTCGATYVSERAKNISFKLINCTTDILFLLFLLSFVTYFALIVVNYNLKMYNFYILNA